MFKKRLIISTAVIALLSSSLDALTLKECVIEAINTNPVVQERLKNYRAIQQDLNVAESEYYPKLDLSAAVGYNSAGNLNSDIVEQDYSNYETQLKLTQNLFDGFGTTNKVDYQEARILAAAYSYVEKSNDIAFKMTNAYLNVLRSYELLQTAHESVEINEDIYRRVKALFAAGHTTNSEVKKIKSALSLSRSNLTVEKNNTRDSEFKFRRILGRMPIVANLVKPEMNTQMPKSIEQAALYSINHNPSLLVSQYNIKGAQSLWKQHEKEFYPTIDLEVSQGYNDVEHPNIYDYPDDRFKARIVMNYNLFNGGADAATVQKDISKINQEVDLKRDLKRQVIEGLDLSWNAYTMIGLQLKDLRAYSEFSETTLELYKKEYDLGNRPLLELLASQTDVINSRSQIITAEYERLFAKYRILDAMGLLPLAIVGDTKEFTSRVNLYTQNDADEILDTLPISYDVDNDKITDNEDLCDNSLLEDNIMPYGCKKITHDSDNDGVLDVKDVCPLTPKNARVGVDGCALDSDSDGVKDYADECPNTPLGNEVDIKGCSLPVDTVVIVSPIEVASTVVVDTDSDGDGVYDKDDKCQGTPLDYKVQANGCTEAVTLTVNFPSNSSEIPEKLEESISQLAEYLKVNPEYEAKVIGHTSRSPTSGEKYNQKLSEKRAQSFRAELINQGIDAERVTAEGRGYKEPIADNATEAGRETNRRIEIELIKKGVN